MLILVLNTILKSEIINQNVEKLMMVGQQRPRTMNVANNPQT